MSKEEAKVTPKVMKWFRKVCPTSAPFEIKHTGESNTFNLKTVQPHQIHWLESCASSIGCIWKIPDANINYNPFDGFFYKNSKAYIIIVYPVYVCAIEIDKFNKIKTPSLHFTEAKELSDFTTQSQDL